MLEQKFKLSVFKKYLMDCNLWLEICSR